jgi:hypothetical protein
MKQQVKVISKKCGNTFNLNFIKSINEKVVTNNNAPGVLVGSLFGVKTLKRLGGFR